MGLKEWLSLDFAKRDATDAPPPPPPSRKASDARPPRPYAQPQPPHPRRTSDARASVYQTPRHHSQSPQDFGAGERPERSRRPSNATSYRSASRQANHQPHVNDFHPHETLASYAARQHEGSRPYQSESGYYFEENGVDDIDRVSTAAPYQEPRRGHRHSQVKHHGPEEDEGEPIVIKGLPRTNSLRMAPEREGKPERSPPPPANRRMSSTGHHARERRTSLTGGNQSPPPPPPPPPQYHQQQLQLEDQPRNSIFDAIRFSWLGLGRSESDNRLSQLATDIPRRSSVQRQVNEDAEVVMQGWLEKCGQQFKTWNHRFFVLRADGVLAYYADEEMKKYKGSINVGYGSKADISMQSNLIDKKNVFMIATESRNMMISAPSQKMMTKWIAKLHAAGATPAEPWDPSKKTVNFFVRDTECPHEWKRYDDPTSYIHIEGCLMKRGHVNKNWKNRFFRIERGELRYYTEGQEQLKGSVDLKGSIVSPGMTQSPDGLKNYFVLTSKDGKFELHLSAPNEQTMHRWIEALQEAQAALGGKGTPGTVTGLALVVKHAEEIPLAKEEVVYEAPELINVELERRMESLIVVSCRAGTVPIGSQLIAVGDKSILHESYQAARHTLRSAMCPLKLHFLIPPYKKGELIKKSRSGFENWKRRVVVVTNGEIQYYKQVSSSNNLKILKHRKTFQLYGCYLNLIQMPGREFCIIVARSPTDKLVLETRNEDERIEWASVIYCSIRMVSQGVTPGHIQNLQLDVAARDLNAENEDSFKQNVSRGF